MLALRAYLSLGSDHVDGAGPEAEAAAGAAAETAAEADRAAPADGPDRSGP
jgi:hypothetical protein